MTPRTLIVSDLHIGSDDGRSVVEREPALERLLAAIDGCERLVLLGDLVELKDSSPQRSLQVAAPILRAIGQRVGPDRELIFLPGNHDRALIKRWIVAQGPALAREALVPHDASSTLAELIAQLAPARVEVRYPGIWLSDRIWAHHGHYLNRYLSPEQGYGLMLRNQPQRRPQPGEPAVAGGEGLATAVPEAPLRPFDFEPAPRRLTAAHLHPHRSAGQGVHGAGQGSDAGLRMERPWHARLHDRILPTRAAALVAPLLSRQVVHHTVPAVVRASEALGVVPEFLIFGHVHRRGPMAGDWLLQWRLDETEVLNTGSWRYEPILVTGVTPPHPYWPGGAVIVERDGLAHTVGLLDDLSAKSLNAPRAQRGGSQRRQ